LLNFGIFFPFVISSFLSSVFIGHFAYNQILIHLQQNLDIYFPIIIHQEINALLLIIALVCITIPIIFNFVKLKIKKTSFNFKSE
jgi:hypothetical protein